ncbi:CHAT domain-containing protein [Aquimarina sp. MMG016]|uniref:CHAT domain-containing protein n=1 Tax=Aquimarina sp. MMG016 TaxID=2822690 RepID=UPI001B39F218|nr:CHAT domain-containing protein [Aquimarina sp. MMG016]MBQ4819294.1 CHAT domain-containing protein [Aquimarina sp. MMG016]
MILKPHFILIISFFTCLISAKNQTPNTTYFEKHYQKINQNIKEEKIEDNFKLIEKLIKQKEYQDLDCYYKGKILHKIGVSYYLLNRESEAIAYFKDKVLHVWKDCSIVPPSERANTIYNIGVSYQYLNELESAKEYIDQALYIFENDPQYPRLKLARKYHGVGKFYQSLNDTFRSELYYQNAINLYKEQDDAKAKEFETINDLITMSMEFKEFAKAKIYIKEALIIHQNFPDAIPQLDLALIYLNAGTTYLGLKEYDIAKRMAKKSLILLDEKKEPFYYSIALELIAMINTDLKNFNQAEQHMNKVIEIRKKLSQKGEYKDAISRAYENLCDIYIRKKDISKANLNLDKAFDFLLPRGSFDTNHLPIIRKSKILDDRHLIRLIELKVRIFKAEYQNSNDILYLKNALRTQHKIDSVINRSLVSFQFEQSKLGFLDLKFEHYGKAIEDALELYHITGDRFYLEEAYYFSSKTKAIVLQYELNQNNAFKSNVSEEILKREKALREEMNKQQTLLLEATINQDSLLQTFTKAQYELDTYLTEIEKKEPKYFKEKYAFIRPPKLKQIQKDLPKDIAVVEYFIAENMIYSFWLTHKSFFPISIPYTDEIKKKLDSFIIQCHNPNEEVSKRQSNIIFDTFLRQGLSTIHKDINRICIIPDGKLHKLSFEALTTINKNNISKYLIEDYTVFYTYSISLLFRDHQQNQLQNYVGFGSKYSTTLNQKLKARKRFFGDNNLMQLALSQEEINRGAAIFDGKIFTNKNASLKNFLEHGPDADIIHLSLHGLVDVDDPSRSCIVFDDHQKEFILSPQDLYGNRLQADLVLLSACHSASGKIYNGEGVQGMSKSFLLGGAHNIMSSLWNASEASSMAITTSFLENIHADLPVDEALHQSKLDYLSKAEPNKKHPYYWGNFILLGEIDSSSKSTNVLIWSIIIGLLLVIIYVINGSKPGEKH